jgi:hypothetical protein
LGGTRDRLLYKHPLTSHCPFLLFVLPSHRRGEDGWAACVHGLVLGVVLGVFVFGVGFGSRLLSKLPYERVLAPPWDSSPAEGGQLVYGATRKLTYLNIVDVRHIVVVGDVAWSR